jgi:hypothetical protein
LVIAALMTDARYGELQALALGGFDPRQWHGQYPLLESATARHIHLSDEGRQSFMTAAARKPSSAVWLARSDGAPWGEGHQSMLDECAIHGNRSNDHGT